MLHDPRASYIQAKFKGKFIGFGKLVATDFQLIEIHGCCLNEKFYDKVLLTKAWFMIIKHCINSKFYTEIRTTCTRDNIKAKKMILNSGFELMKNPIPNNLIYFRLNQEKFLQIENNLFKKV